MSIYVRSEAGQTSPGVEPLVPAIPDRVALTNERLYPRSRLLSLAKQHLIATNLKSAQIVQALLKKREEGDSRPKRRVSRVAERIRETTRTLSSAVVGAAQSPSSPAGQGTRIIHVHPESPSPDKEAEKIVTPLDVKDVDTDDSRGRSPVRPHHLQYTHRYSVGLRGLTPSPMRVK
ncbi:hypothetical protein BJ165DRAFT_1612086 [Panaeolus papilionaceus]|nr:hypothetical protein BJ165DRAFT_1612086 [Panaeolus papilionaceus]